MSESDLRERFKEYRLKYENEVESGRTQIKALVFELTASQPFSSARQIQTQAGFTLFRTDSVYRLYEATYYNTLWDCISREVEDVYAAILDELTAQYGQPQYQFSTDFSDIVPHYTYRNAVSFTTDRWHLGHNMIDLFIDILAEEDTSRTEPAYNAYITEKYSLFIDGVSDLEYDRVSETGILMPRAD